jgi:hypothetical protein
MALVALAALNLAVARAAPWEIVSFPSLWVLLGTIDFVVFWKLILRRSLQAFHYTCLIVFVVAFLVMANLVATERFRPLSPLVRWYQHLTGEKTDSISIAREFLGIGDFWMACFLSLMLGSAIGLVAAWLEGRQGWDIAAFFRGALIGFAVATLLASIDGALWGRVIETRSRLIGHLVLLGICLLLGGLMGLSRLKSTTPGREVQVVGGQASSEQGTAAAVRPG